MQKQNNLNTKGFRKIERISNMSRSGTLKKLRQEIRQGFFPDISIRLDRMHT